MDIKIEKAQEQVSKTKKQYDVAMANTTCLGEPKSMGIIIDLQTEALEKDGEILAIKKTDEKTMASDT